MSSTKTGRVGECVPLIGSEDGSSGLGRESVESKASSARTRE